MKEVEEIEGLLSSIRAVLKVPGKIAGYLKQKLASDVSQVTTLFSQLKHAFTSKHRSSCGEDGFAVIRKHFKELLAALSQMGMDELAAEAYSKGLISDQIKHLVLSSDATSTKKADALLSAIQVRIKTDPNTFDTFVEILRSQPAYQPLADKLTRKLPGNMHSPHRFTS